MYPSKVFSSADSSKLFNEFFYKSEAEKPAWMSFASEGSGRESDQSDEEDHLLDDALFISRTHSIDSTCPLFSRATSLESQDSGFFNDYEVETEVALRVAMCCGKCEDKVKTLTQLEGVVSVVCDRKTEKVVVTGTARPSDILKACRKLFEQAKMWSPDDGLGDLISTVEIPIGGKKF